MKKPAYDEESLRVRGASRARLLPQRLGVTADRLVGARILEVGCGNGETTIAVRDLYRAEVIGVEPFPRFEGQPWGGEGVFIKADIVEVGGIDPVDFVHSYTVWEHIDRPREALQKVFELLRPGGSAYLAYNLYRGASASHLTGYLPDLPWMQLLYSDTEIRELMIERHGVDRGMSWVNKLTWAHYLAYFQEIGFRTDAVWYTRTPMDPGYYRQHEAKLKPYPMDDLERNFMHVRLIKPTEEARDP